MLNVKSKNRNRDVVRRFSEREAQYNWPTCANKFRSANFHIKTFFTFFKQATSMRRSTVLRLPLHLVSVPMS